MAVYFPNQHTAAEWTEMAAECSRRSAESFERCDTDGFMSQWASDTTARVYRQCAKVAENGGKAEFVVLCDLDGNELDARQVEGRYGYSWMIRNADGSVSWFNESKAQNEERAAAANAKKGYQFRTVEKEAVVITFGTSIGNVGVGMEPKRAS